MMRASIEVTLLTSRNVDESLAEISDHGAGMEYFLSEAPMKFIYEDLTETKKWVVTDHTAIVVLMGGALFQI